MLTGHLLRQYIFGISLEIYNGEKGWEFFLVKQDVFVNKIVILVCYILCCKKDFFYSMGEYIILNNLILFHASLLFKFCLG